MHTLPLPEMTDLSPAKKIATGNSRLDTPPRALPVRSLSIRPSAGLRGPGAATEASNSQRPFLYPDSASPSVASTRIPGTGCEMTRSAMTSGSACQVSPPSPIASSACPINYPAVGAAAAGVAVSTASKEVGPAPRGNLTPAHLSSQQLQFLMRVTPPALASESEYGIPACVTIAQAVLESATAAGWGSSPLFRLANNPFGIKYAHLGLGDWAPRTGEGKSHQPATGSATRQSLQPMAANGRPALPGPNPNSSGTSAPSGPPAAASQASKVTAVTSGFQHPVPAAEDYGAFEAATWEIEDGRKVVISAEFQRFPSLEEAFRAHAWLLCSPRYQPAFAVRHDWKQFAERLGPKSSSHDLEHCGYSTNPNYSAALVKLVNLYRLDDPRAQQWYATGHDPGPESSVSEPSSRPPNGGGGGQKAAS